MTIPALVEFSAGSGGDNYESFFQTSGCLVSRHGRLFVQSFDREDQAREVALLTRTERDRHNFPGKKNVEWFERSGAGRTRTGAADGVSPRSSMRRAGRGGRKGDRHRRRSQSPFLPGRAVNGGGSDGVSAAIGVASTDTGSMKSGFARLIVYFSLYLDRRRGPL